MKCLIVLILASVFCTAPAAAAVIAAYSGTTNPFGGPTNWNAPNVARGATTCVVGTTAIAYANFSVTFPTAGVYQVKCMFENAFKSNSIVLVYSGGVFNPSTAAACTGFVKSAAENTGLSGGPRINDGIYFNAASYSFVVTGTSTSGLGLFACQISSSSYGGSTSASSTPVLNPVSNSAQDGSCTSGSAEVPATTFSWQQPITGRYDISIYFSNTTFSGTGFGANAALYNTSNVGFLTNGTANDPCSFPSLVISAAYSEFAVFLQNITLIAGHNYTVAFAGDSTDAFGYWGASIDPSVIGSNTNSPAWTQPDRGSGACTASSYTAAHFFTITFVAQHETYIFDTQETTWGTSLDTYSFLYVGLNNGSIPAACPAAPVALIFQGDTGDSTPLAFQGLTVNQAYTVVVSSYFATDVGDFSYFLFTGTQIGNLPPPPTSGATGASTATNGASTATNGASTATNGASTATNGASTATNGGATANAVTTGGSGAAELMVSVMTLIASVCITFLM
jgi:hypothetical protein